MSISIETKPRAQMLTGMFLKRGEMAAMGW
jgi:hypothetical protein